MSAAIAAGPASIAASPTHPSKNFFMTRPDDKRAIATEEFPPMRCQDSARETVSVTGREGQAALSDARGSTRIGSAEGRAQRELSPRLLHGRSGGRAARVKGTDQ